jgi:deazaflavin-dependent oxidoreductase (nitroreductase family)
MLATPQLGNAADVTTVVPLPYGPVLRRLLRPIQRGFLYLNRWLVRPVLRSPFGRFIGTALTPQLLLLRTRGRRTGVVREAPLGYVIRDGFVYVVAGYGVGTPWYLNLLDNPTVEVVLPGRTIRGVAESVTDEAEWLRSYRALIGSFGLIGRVVEGDPSRMDDATLLATHRSLPVVRIRALEPPGPTVAGAWDPGGHGRLIAWAIVAAAGLSALTLRSRRTRFQPSQPQSAAAPPAPRR